MGLTRMSTEPGWHVRPGEPALLGFSVIDDHGDFLGEVVDLIVDTTFQRVPFVVVMAANGLHARDRVIVPMRQATLKAEQREIVVGDSINALDVHVVDDGRELSQLIDAKLAATFVPDVDAVPSLETGSGETTVDADAAILEVRHRRDYCEKVDEVSLRDASGEWVAKPSAENRDTCRGEDQAP